MNGEGGERLLAGVELGRRRRSSRQRRVGWLGVGGKLRRDVSHVGRGGRRRCFCQLSGWDRQKLSSSFLPFLESRFISGCLAIIDRVVQNLSTWDLFYCIPGISYLT